MDTFTNQQTGNPTSNQTSNQKNHSARNKTKNLARTEPHTRHVPDIKEMHAIGAEPSTAEFATTEAATTEASAAEATEAPETYQLLLIPLSQLRPSSRNVRQSGGTAIPELAASIARIGLLQNLTVTASSDGEHYEVVAGKRRLAALKLLVKQRKLGKDHDVPCLRVPDASARTVSLTENIHREAMHPGEQFEAFAALVAEGRPVEDIAADFGVTPLVVQRRLRLANVSPRLMADYRADAVTLDQLMALAITDDHHAQERAFYESPGWQRSPQALREQLTEREIDAATDALAKFVGIEAYVAAGGGVRRDLFSDNIQGGYLSDGALLERLARDKLAAAAEEARAEGWAWVDAVPRMTAAQLHGFQHARRERRMPNKTQAKRITKLQARQQAIENRLNSDEAEDLPEAEAQALYDESDQIEAELDGIEQTLMMFAPETLAIAGTIVTVDHLGNVAVHRGLLREADAKAFRARSAQHVSRASHGPAQGDDDHDPHHQHEQHSDGHDDDNPDATLASGISEKLARRLSAHRTAALQFEVARHPQVALVALVQRLALRVLFDAYDMRASPVNINATSQRGLDAYAPEVAQSASVTSLHALHQTWRDRLPEEPDALFTVLLGLSQEELLALLAVCVASTVNAVTHEDGDIPAAALAQAVGLDMHAWWTPTAESYFSHVSKANILAVVESVDPLQVNRLSKLKKDALASEAERLIQGSGWLPVMLCSPALRAPEILAMEVETVH